MWWIIGIALWFVCVIPIYGLIRAGAREDEMKERLRERLHEEIEKRKDGTRCEAEE